MPRFIDVDLSVIPQDQAAGSIDLTQEQMCAGVRTDDYETFGEMIPRSKWKSMAAAAEKLLRSLVSNIKSQGRESSCVGNGCTGAGEFAANFQFGLKHGVVLSAMSLYERIGRSSGSGAYIPDGVNEMVRFGALPVDNEANRSKFNLVYPATGFNPRRLSRLNWKPQASLFRFARVLRVNTVDAWFSALIRGKPIIYGRQSHCIYSVLPLLHKNRWFFGYINSWGQWGDEVNDSLPYGMGYDSEAVISQCTGYAVEDIVVRGDVLS